MSLSVYKRMKTHPEAVDIVKFKVREVLANIAADPFELCEVVAGGPELWRKTIHAAFRPYPMTDDIADRMYLFLSAAVQAMFGAGGSGGQGGFTSEHIEAAAIAGDFLDSCSPLPGAPNADDIRKAWKIEDASAPEQQKAQYGDLHPQEWLDRIVAMDADQKGND